MKSRFNFILSIKNKSAKETTRWRRYITEQAILLIHEALIV